jgi:hypothetical protein
MGTILWTIGIADERCGLVTVPRLQLSAPGIGVPQGHRKFTYK